MMAKPFASIIIPTYNHERYIGQALDSVLAQTDGDFEAIVVNDGSTDRSGQIIDAYAARDSRIVPVHQANSGVAGALNAGLERTRGEWVHWLSSDDMFEPHKLAVNREWIKRHPDTNFFFSYFSLLRQRTGELTRHDLWGPLPAPEEQVITLFYRNYMSGITICIRRTEWERIGFFDPSLRYGQDYDQWLRLLRENQAVFIADWLAINRNHDEQGSEIFPEACYFDTARAAIQFLNETPFQRLFPFVDLTHAESARNAVAKTLDYACDPTAYVYSLGPHPGLILRLLEWLRSDAVADQELQAELATLVGRRILDLALADADDDWHWMWRGIAAAWADPGARFVFRPIDPASLGLVEHGARLAGRGSGKAAPLKEYLERFHGIEVPSRPAGAAKTLAFVAQDQGGKPRWLSEHSRRLVRQGHRVALITGDVSRGCYAWDAGVVSLACADLAAVALLGSVDVCFADPASRLSAWIEAERLPGRAKGPGALAAVPETATGPNRTEVILVERAFSGGGAERVVADVASRLDPGRYKVSVAALFESQPPPDLPRRLELVRLWEQAGAPWQPVAAHLAGSASFLPRLYYLLAPLYRSVLNERLRAQLELGAKMRAALRRARSARTRLSAWRQKLGRRSPPVAAAAGQPPPESGPQAVPSLAAPPRSDLMACHNIFLASAATHWPHAFRLAEHLRSRPPGAVVISVMEEAAVCTWMARLYARSFKQVASLHIHESSYLKELYPDAGRLQAEAWLFENATAGAERVVFPSAGCADDLKQNFAVAKARVEVIRNPVNLSRIKRLSYLPLAPEAPPRREPFRFVCVGRLVEQKNHRVLIDACDYLAREGGRFDLVLVGEGHLRDEIRRHAEACGLGHRVHLVGFAENPYPYIAEADALVLSSDYEAFGLVLVEAMALGTPVLATDCPAGPAEVLENGRYGLLVPPGQPTALAREMQRLMDDGELRDRLVEAGLARAADYDVARVARQWSDLIDEIAGKTVARRRSGEAAELVH